MATKQGTMDYLLDQLQSLRDIRSRKMFGQYALYVGEKVAGFVCDDTLFLKITPEGKKFLGDKYAEGPAYPGSKPYIKVDPELYDDGKFLSELVDITASALPKPKLKLKKKK